MGWFRKSKETNKADDYLLSNLEFYKAAFLLSQDAKLVINEGGKIIKFNNKAIELFGYTPEELGDKDFVDLVSKDDINCIKNVWNRNSGKRSCSCELLDAIGAYVPATVYFNPLHVNGEQLTFLTIRDITELEEAYEQLELISMTIQEVLTGMVITDVNGRIIWANKTVSILTGYPTKELLGQNPRVLKSGLTMPSVFDEMWSTIKSGNRWSGQVMNRRKNGTIYNDSMTILPVTLNNEIFYFMAIKEDLTSKHFPTEDDTDSVESLKNLFADSDIGFLMVGLDNLNVEFMNGVIKELVKDSSEVSSIKDIFDKESVEKFDIYFNTIKKYKPLHINLKLKKDNKKVDLYVLRPFKNYMIFILNKFD